MPPQAIAQVWSNKELTARKHALVWVTAKGIPGSPGQVAVAVRWY